MGFDTYRCYVVFPRQLTALLQLPVRQGGVEEGVVDHFGQVATGVLRHGILFPHPSLARQACINSKNRFASCGPFPSSSCLKNTYASCHPEPRTFSTQPCSSGSP